MPRPTSPFRTPSFRSLNDDLGVELQDDEAAAILNLYRDRGTLKRRGGTTPLGSSNLYPVSEIDGLFWARLNDRNYLLAAHNGRITDWFDASPGVEITNSAGKHTAGADTSFAWIEDAVVIGDGQTANTRFTGTRVDQLSVAPVTSGFSGVVFAGGSLPVASYTYKVAYLTAAGDAGLASAAITVGPTGGANLQIRLTLPALPAGSDASGWRIYRLPSGGTEYKVVADVTATPYDDTILDAALTDAGTSEPNLTSDAFPPCAILVEWHNRLLGADCRTAAGDRRTLYISNFRGPAYCPAAPDLEDPTQGTQIKLQGAGAGNITAILPHGDRVYVFTGGQAWTLVGDEPIDYSLTPFAEVGCIAHRTAKAHRDRILWLADDGVYMATARGTFDRISDNVRNTLAGLTATQRARAWAQVWDEKYILGYPTVGAAVGGALVFDLRYDQWSTLAAWPFRVGACSVPVDGARCRLFGALSAVGRVWEMETGITDNGAAIATRYKTRDFDLGLPGREKRLHYFGATWKVGVGTATVVLSRDTGEVVQTETHNLATPVVTGGAVARLDARANEGARAEHFAIEITHADADAAELILAAIDGRWTLAT